MVVVLYDGFQSLDAFGPIEVLGGAPRAYEVTVVAPRAGAVRASNGISVNVERGISDVTGSIDTLLVAGGDGTRTAVTDPDVVDAVRTLAGRARRVASVCSGSFLLAAAGVLDGRRATTHWAWCDELRRRYPAVTVESDPIYVRARKGLAYLPQEASIFRGLNVEQNIRAVLEVVEKDRKVRERNLDELLEEFHISHLRKKLERPGAEIIRTVRGVGYLFVPDSAR